MIKNQNETFLIFDVSTKEQENFDMSQQNNLEFQNENTIIIHRCKSELTYRIVQFF